MAYSGTRLLSLDGGGTRGLATLYILREVLNNVVPGSGGNVRPCEYFDLIGGAGLSGLCALLFVRFSYTVDEAIDFLHDLSQKLDDVEKFRINVLAGEVDDAEDWLNCIKEYEDPVEQLVALRQGIVQDCWEAVIKKNIVDGLEMYLYMENGKFNFMNPPAVVEVGRSKAFVVSSESKGYGSHGGVVDTRRYNVPILHRTYNCRHGKTLYTLYAVALATVASPAIMKPGVIFPDFLATGRHTVHNPSKLILEESNKLWPGLRVAVLLSIGTGRFEFSHNLSKSLISTTALACLDISNDSQMLAEEIITFIVPFDKDLKLAYFRFNSSAPIPFHEFSARNFIEKEVKLSLTKTKDATQAAYAANALKSDGFPTASADLLALASLACLLHALVEAGYTHEAAIITDVISNFIIYEAAAGEDGSFRKLSIATEAEQVGGMLSRMHEAYAKGNAAVVTQQLSEGAILNGLLTFGDHAQGREQPPRELSSLSDYAAGAYYFLTVLRRDDSSEMELPRFRRLLRQLSSLLKMPAEVTQQFTVKMESLLELATLAALCEAGTAQALRGFKGLSHNGSLIRHIQNIICNTSMNGVSQKIVGPIANMMAINIEMCNWSPFRDNAIINLLETASEASDENLSLLNLALGPHNRDKKIPSETSNGADINSVCESFLKKYSGALDFNRSQLLIDSVKNGWFRLLWKSILEKDQTSGGSFSRATEEAFHLAAQLGYPYIMKKLVEGLGMDLCKALVNQPDSEGRTPLHIACMHRAPKEVFRLLYTLGANRNARCDLGRTPLHYCFPNQNSLPSVHSVVINMILDHPLPTTQALDLPKGYGIDGKAKPLDPRVCDFRVIVNQLLYHQADMSISDHDGLTPLHKAAKEGWGGNIDLFFMHDHRDSERFQRICLKACDDDGLTVLDHARIMGTKGFINGGEDTIIEEMRKRAMEIPPEPPQLMTLEPQWRKVTIGKPLTKSVDSDPGISSEATATNVLTSKEFVTSSPPRSPVRFPPAQVYQDPEFLNSGSKPEASSSMESKDPIIVRKYLGPPVPTETNIKPQSSQKWQPYPDNVGDDPEPKRKSRFLKKLMKGK